MEDGTGVQGSASVGGRGVGARKLFSLLCLLLIVWNIFDFTFATYLARSIKSGVPAPKHWGNFSLTIPAAFIVFEMLIALWICNRSWPVIVAALKPRRGTLLFYDILWGIGAGILAFALGMPRFLHGSAFSSQAWGVILNRDILVAFLLLVALPVTTELFFRGIVFPELSGLYGLPSGAILSSLTFALLWPVLGFLMGLLLSAVACVLYYKRHSLLSCIVANVVLTICAGAWVIFLPLALG